MSRYTNPIVGLSGVEANQTVTGKCQSDRRYHGFLINYSNAASRLAARAATQAEMEADIGEIRFIANSKVLRRFTVAQLNLINALNGIAVRAGQEAIFFSDPKRRTPDGEEWGAFTAYGIPGVTLEVDVTATADAPQMTIDQVYDYVPDRNKGFILWEKKSVVNPNAGDLDIDGLTKKGAYSRIHLFTDKISRVLVKVDEVAIHDRTPEKIKAFLAPYGLVVQAGTTPVVFDFTQQISDALDMTKKAPDGKTDVAVDSFVITPTHTAGVATYQYIVERLIANVAAYVA
jgi:hypothetical protein